MSREQPLLFTQDLVINSHVAHNAGVLHFSRTWVALVAGSILGILGWAGWSGFLWYLAAQTLATGLLYRKADADPARYFTSTWALYIDEVFAQSALLTFIMFWTLGYSCIHLF